MQIDRFADDRGRFGSIAASSLTQVAAHAAIPKARSCAMLSFSCNIVHPMFKFVIATD